jgi:hypothetical protein
MCVSYRSEQQAMTTDFHASSLALLPAIFHSSRRKRTHTHSKEAQTLRWGLDSISQLESAALFSRSRIIRGVEFILLL